MDSSGINKAGISPLKPELDSIRAIHNIAGLLHTAARLQGMGVSCLFDDGADQDDKNSNLIVFQLGQGGLGLPNRDYYFKTDEKSTRVRNAYQTLPLPQFPRARRRQHHGNEKCGRRIRPRNQGSPPPPANSQTFAIPNKNYNKFALAGLPENNPGHLLGRMVRQHRYPTRRLHCRRPARILYRPRQGPDQRPARHLEGLPRNPPHPILRILSRQHDLHQLL